MNRMARHVIFKGRVQGVGFRYTVRQIAARYDLAGTVRNCPDGSVEAVFQGSPDRVQDCLDDIRQYFEDYIRDVHSTEQVYNPHLTDFQITH
jgi:acylphosphatase